MNAAASVSVIIPTRDRADLVMRALASVYAQTRLPREVIVVDDGSVDDTAAQVRARYPQARCISLPGRGVSAARNAGLIQAGGHWVAFLDSDDTWHPQKLARQAAAAAAQPDYSIVHTDEIWIRGGRRVNPKRRHAKHGGRIFHRCLPLCVISPSAVMIRRALFDEVGPFDEALPACEDYDMWLRLCVRHPVLFVPEALVTKYGGHDDQLSRRYRGMDRFRIRSLEKLLAGTALAPDQEAAVLATLMQKAAVYGAGAAKRGRDEEARRYQGKIASYRDRLRRLGGLAGAATGGC